MGKEYLKPKAAAKPKATYVEVLQKQIHEKGKKRQMVNTSPTGALEKEP